MGRLLYEVVTRKCAETGVHLDQERHQSWQNCCDEAVCHLALCPGYDDDAVEERVGGGTEVAEGEKSIYGDDDDPAWKEMSSFSCFLVDNCTYGSLSAKTTVALTLPVQWCCSMKSILKTSTMMKSSNEMLSTTMAVQRLYYDPTVSYYRVVRKDIVTYHRSALLRELCPRRTRVASQSDHQHRRKGHEQTSDYAALCNELVQSFRAQGVKKAYHSSSRGECCDEVKDVAGVEQLITDVSHMFTIATVLFDISPSPSEPSRLPREW